MAELTMKMPRAKWERVGLVVRSVHPISTGVCVVPAGALAIVLCGGPVTEVLFSPCATCGTQPRVRKADLEVDFTIVHRGLPAPGPNRHLYDRDAAAGSVTWEGPWPD